MTKYFLMYYFYPINWLRNQILPYGINVNMNREFFFSGLFSVHSLDIINFNEYGGLYIEQKDINIIFYDISMDWCPLVVEIYLAGF